MAARTLLQHRISPGGPIIEVRAVRVHDEAQEQSPSGESAQVDLRRVPAVGSSDVLPIDLFGVGLNHEDETVGLRPVTQADRELQRNLLPFGQLQKAIDRSATEVGRMHIEAGTMGALGTAAAWPGPHVLHRQRDRAPLD